MYTWIAAPKKRPLKGIKAKLTCKTLHIGKLFCKADILHTAHRKQEVLRSRPVKGVTRQVGSVILREEENAPFEAKSLSHQLSTTADPLTTR
jgi:hypothetical protein